MDFKDYQKTSLKHLTTCKIMLDSMDNLISQSTALINNENKKKALLHNMFYLSGYTLESIINYSIFKHFKWTEPSIYVTDHKFSARSGVSFYPNTGRLVDRGVYPFWMSQHNFQRNIQILSKALPASKIPLIDKTIKIDSDLIKLYKSWQIEMRYHPQDTTYDNLVLSEDNVKRFVGLTEIVYNNLMKIVG